MREKHGIAVADPLVEIDRSFSRIGAEIGGGIVDAKAHCHILPVKLAAPKPEYCDRPAKKETPRRLFRSPQNSMGQIR
jgi:hypothetical protein